MTDDPTAGFADAVTMTAGQLHSWLDTEQSKSVGQKSGGPESTGHRSGAPDRGDPADQQADRSDADRAHMRKVVGYVQRHLAQRPSGDVQDTAWRYSLMNWGHDPLAKGR